MEGLTKVSPSCANCGLRQNVMKRCSRCKNVLYCSKECQIKKWATHRHNCLLVNSGQRERQNFQHGQAARREATAVMSRTPITIKCNHKKHNINLLNIEESSGKELIGHLSKQLRIPVDCMKVVGQGKLVNEDNIKEIVLQQKCKVFQAFGEEAEDEEGLDIRDIEAIIDELKVSRNRAIRSLRSCNGDLIDAILELGNKL